MTGGQAIRKYCVECMNGQAREVARCTDENCVWYDYRFGKNTRKLKGGALKAIRNYCLYECVGREDSNMYDNVKNCNPDNGCTFHKFRFGKNPDRKPLTEEQLKRARDRAKKHFLH